MQIPNIKIYIGISLALIFLFILILILPFSKKISPQKTDTSSSNQPFPTSVETSSSNPSLDQTSITPIVIPADFTGAAEEQLPKQALDLAVQKKDLRQKTPLDLPAFIIDFDYGEDKFIVTLKDPKDQSQKVFESWRISNYPGLSADQFLLK